MERGNQKMKRRDLLATSCLATAAPLLGAAAEAAEDQSAREFYELRRYTTAGEAQQQALATFLQQAAVPALNRAGVGPVGLFEELEGEKAVVFALLPHKSLESVVGLQGKLEADAGYQAAGASVLNTPKAEPAYQRIESWLLQAFSHMPKLVAPEKKDSRIFELRTYESHSEKMGLKKIEMFNDGGEIDLFRRVGLQAVFFGQTLFGTQLPNLTYLLAFDDMADHDADWKRFLEDPGWLELRGKAEYKDTVSHITKTFLRPLPGSQL